MEEVIKYLKEKGIPDGVIKKVFACENVYTTKPDTLLKRTKENIEYFFELGYSLKNVSKMLKIFPTVLTLAKESLEQKIKDFRDLGFNDDEIKRAFVGTTELFGYDLETIKLKILKIQELGFSEEEALYMVKDNPRILILSIENNISSKLTDLKKLLFSDEEVKKIVLGYPKIFGEGFSKIASKVELFRNLGIEFILLLNPSKLMQSKKKTYLRYKYFESIGKSIDEYNYWHLFYDSDRFKRAFLVTDEEIESKIPYNLEERNDLNV